MKGAARTKVRAGKITMVKIRLNDFKSFNHYLFGDSEPDWSKFYDKETDIFTPPILDPETEAEYQLDHYALWIVIYAFGLMKKPLNWGAVKILHRCYACAYSAKKGKYNTFPCRICCPLELNGDYTYCGSAYYKWYCSNEADTAYDIAHLEWRDI